MRKIRSYVDLALTLGLFLLARPSFPQGACSETFEGPVFYEGESYTSGECSFTTFYRADVRITLTGDHGTIDSIVAERLSFPDQVVLSTDPPSYCLGLNVGETVWGLRPVVVVFGSGGSAIVRFLPTPTTLEVNGNSIRGSNEFPSGKSGSPNVFDAVRVGNVIEGRFTISLPVSDFRNSSGPGPVDFHFTLNRVANSCGLISPVILVHGNNSDGGFFVRQGFTKVLQDKKVLFDNSITMVPTAPVDSQAKVLSEKIPEIAERFKKVHGGRIDGVHIIAHSKGGLDTRAYLAMKSDKVNVLSLTTLSTPHEGSVLADIAMSFDQGRIADAGTPDLTTWSAADFNRTNVPRLREIESKSKTVFSTLAADMDGNKSGMLEPQEIKGLAQESEWLEFLLGLNAPATADLLSRIYRIMSERSAVTIRVTLLPDFRFEEVVETRTEPIGNDLLVAIPSGHSVTSRFFLPTLNRATFCPKCADTPSFAGGPAGTLVLAGKNHSSVADEDVARVVVGWLEQIDLERRARNP